MSERWSGPFLTVNQAGLGLALTLVALSVVWALLPRQRGWWWVLHAGLLASWTALAGLLAASGSRGAWLGLAAAMLWLMRVGLVPWRWCAAGALALCLLIAVLPGGRERFAAGMWDHPSIQHRLALIEGTLALAWDHPHGVAEAHALAERWYLPPGVRGKYASSLNDALVVITRHGWTVSAAVQLAVALVLAVGMAPSWRSRPVVAGATAGLLVLLLAGLAQGHLTTTQVSWPRWCAGGLALLLIAAVARPLAGAGWPAQRRILATALFTTVGLGAVMLALMAWAAARHPLATHATTAGLVVMPRSAAPRGRMLLAAPATPWHRQRSMPGWAVVAVNAGWAVGVVEDGSAGAWRWWQPHASVTLGEASGQASEWTLPALLIDPEVLPEGTGPITVARGRWAPFAPTSAALADWTAADTRRIVREYRRQALLPERDGSVLSEWLATVPTVQTSAADASTQR